MDSNPKMIAAGKWGRRAIQALWRAAKIHGRRGVLAKGYLSGTWLAEFTHDGCEDARDYELGIKAAVKAGLLVVQPDGSGAIHDWDSYQWDDTAAERMRRHRERKAESGSTVRYGSVTAVTEVTAVTATPPQPHPNPTPQGAACAPVGSTAPAVEGTGLSGVIAREWVEVLAEKGLAAVPDLSGAGIAEVPLRHLAPDKRLAVLRAFRDDADAWVAKHRQLRFLDAGRVNGYLLAESCKPADKWAKSVLGERW